MILYDWEGLAFYVTIGEALFLSSCAILLILKSMIQLNSMKGGD